VQILVYLGFIWFLSAFENVWIKNRITKFSSFFMREERESIKSWIDRKTFLVLRVLMKN
jgi:hypothetical protein